ncbi:hypothetical protein LTR10_023075 [Elasticomyces elasticus]|uniref:SMC hinge domain-containing protein n=1 Tax=Exophiala sideris TaxID=1016849 RepID=A0ABR0JMR7_9EURO|nr:hypothetical protein LTR10_023075 [Elasticomyces elasticus]KAK5036350.1 hypothetical protein LTS07_002077 [Exophiala sideris]KAK5041818.1 hypothetical protein LTR13_002485 [Exophiala sideris]KAK5066734.1 hypothetical protein LTR69_002081 [Exophiala sideris]KAK5184792.1 hypothetical protein LTR44_002638 [Eurotiomycetes sp. CCFEE 6388]
MASDQSQSTNAHEAKQKDDATSNMKNMIQILETRSQDLSHRLAEATTEIENLKSAGENLQNVHDNVQAEVNLLCKNSVNLAYQVEKLCSERTDMVQKLEQSLQEAQDTIKTLGTAKTEALQNVQNVQKTAAILEEERDTARDALKASERLYSERNGKVRDLEESLREAQSTASLYRDLFTVATGHERADTMVTVRCELVQQWRIMLKQKPLKKPRLTYIEGLATVRVAEMSAVDLAMQQFFQIHAVHGLKSASSVFALAIALENCDDESLSEAISLLYAALTMLITQSDISYIGSLMILQLFELVCSASQEVPEILSMVATTFDEAKPKQWSEGVLLPAMTDLVTRLLKQEFPSLRRLIVSAATDRSLLVEAGQYQMSIDDQNLLVVNADDNVAFLRPPHFSVDLVSLVSSTPIRYGPVMIFEDAPMIGTCTLAIAAERKDFLNRVCRLRPCLKRLDHRFTAEERHEVEMIDA